MKKITIELTDKIEEQLKDKILNYKELMNIFNTKKTTTRENFRNYIISDKEKRYFYDGNSIIKGLKNGI